MYMNYAPQFNLFVVADKKIMLQCTVKLYLKQIQAINPLNANPVITALRTKRKKTLAIT